MDQVCRLVHGILSPREIQVKVPGTPGHTDLQDLLEVPDILKDQIHPTSAKNILYGNKTYTFDTIGIVFRGCAYFAKFLANYSKNKYFLKNQEIRSIGFKSSLDCNVEGRPFKLSAIHVSKETKNETRNL